MSEIKGTKTHQNLVKAFVSSAEANHRYLSFARQADIDGYSSVASLFRAASRGEREHAEQNLGYLKPCGDPYTNRPIGTTVNDLVATIESELREAQEMYPEMAKIAREEGFDEIAQWFETLTKTSRSHAKQFQEALDTLEEY